MRNNYNTKIKNRGLSLTETLLVLGVISLVSVIAYKGYESAIRIVKSAGESQGIITTINGIQRTFSQSEDYSELTTAIVLDAELEPLYFRSLGSGPSAVLRGLYGTPITIGPQTAPVANPSRFQVVEDQLPQAACIDIAMNASTYSLAVYVSQAGVAPSASDAIKAENSTGANLIAAVAKCSGSPTKRITIIN